MLFHTKLIVVATDFSENALHALKASVDFLQIPKTRLVVVHVTDNAEEDHLHQLNLKLDTYIKNFFQHNEPTPLPERVILSNKITYKAIEDYINKLEPYMLVVGAKGTAHIKNLHIGSTTHQLLEKSNCPVLVVPIMKD
jgi:hypothetical protein